MKAAVLSEVVGHLMMSLNVSISISENWNHL